MICTILIPDHKGTEVLAKVERLTPRYRRLSSLLPGSFPLFIVAGLLGTYSNGAWMAPAVSTAVAAIVTGVLGFVYFRRLQNLYVARRQVGRLAREVKVESSSVLVIEILQHIRVSAAMRQRGEEATRLFDRILAHYLSGEKEAARGLAFELNALTRD